MYLIYYKTAEGNYRVYHEETKQIETIDTLPRDTSKFEMLTHDDIEATDDGLKSYAKLFRKWCTEMKDNRYINIDYSSKYCNFTAVTTNFNRKAAKYYKDHEPITTTEWKWFERCYNSGLQSLEKMDITVKCWSYDFKQQYPRVMNSDNMIPNKPGEEVTLKKLPVASKLLPGFYHVKITCDDPNFRKIFSFSKQNVYIMESLAHAMKHKRQFDVEFELVDDGEPNAYLYDEDDMVTLKSICGPWYRFMVRAKERCPGNRLIKHLFSSCWTSMNAHTKIYRTWKQIEEQELEIGYCSADKTYEYDILDYKDSNDTYLLLPTATPYTSNIRLKPWIAALARNLTAEMVLQDIDNVVRVQTDSVSYSVEQTFHDEGFIPEAKTTGKIHFQNVNAYKNLTTGYTSGAYKQK